MPFKKSYKAIQKAIEGKKKKKNTYLATKFLNSGDSKSFWTKERIKKTNIFREGLNATNRKRKKEIERFY